MGTHDPTPETTAPTAVLSVRDAWRRFGAVTALGGVSVEVRRNEILALLGPSGCGKTTLLRAIAGLEQLDEGTLWIDGRDVTAVPPQERGVSMVFQDAGLFPHLTARRNIEIAMRARVGRRGASGAIATRVEEVATLVRIPDLLDRRPHELSGGQRQRVGIARALIADPSLLLMDEPFAALDADLRIELRRELVRLRRLGAIAETVFVTHDQTEALGIADRIAVMFEGIVAQVGTPAELLDGPATLQVARFLGVPRINAVAIEGAHTLGLRPSDLLPPAEIEAPRDRPRLLVEGETVTSEPFAGQLLVTFRTANGHELEGVAPWETRIAPGETMTWGCDAGRLYFFDAADGTRAFPDEREVQQIWERV